MRSTLQIVNEDPVLDRLVIKTKSGTLCLSTETAALLSETMAELEVEDPQFAIQAALKTWLEHPPAVQDRQPLVVNSPEGKIC